MKKRIMQILSLVTALVMLLGVVPSVPVGAAAASATAAPAVQGEGAVGAILGAAAQRNEPADEPSESITDVTIDGRNAFVTLVHTQACMVVVGIYDETGETLLQTARERGIPAEAGTAALNFDGDLPEFFLLRAYLLDENCAPLGRQYETDRYTQAYRDFLDKTTADFPAADVLNFDDDTHNNFAVFDSAVTPVAVGEHNHPTIGENGYTFTDADDSLRGLREGDIFTFDNGGVPEIVKVGALAVSGDTVTVTPAEAEMEEVFDYVKIDVTSDGAEVDMSDADEGVTLAETDDPVGAGAAYELPRHFTFDLERMGVKGELDVTATLRFKLYYTDGILETELTDEVEGELDVAVGFRLESAFRLCKLHFPTPVAGLMIAVEVEFVPEIAAEFHGKVNFSQKIGCAYSSENGFTNLSQTPQLDAEVNFEGSVFIGFQLTPSVEALFGVVELGMACKLGAEGVGTRVLTTTDCAASNHCCRWCIDGAINGKVEIAAEIETGFLKQYRYTVSVKLLDWEKKLFDFYVSSDAGSGKGACPNRQTPPATGDVPDYEPMKITYTEDYTANYVISGDRKHLDIYVTGSGNITSYDGFGRDVFVTKHLQELQEQAEELYPYDWDKRNIYINDHKIQYGYSVSYHISGFTAVSCHENYKYTKDVHISGPTKAVSWGSCHSITLPDSVEELYVQSVDTTSVRIPPNVKYISGFNSSALTELTIPSSAELVDGFSNCPITKLTIMPPKKGLTLKGFWQCPIENLVFPPKVKRSYFQPSPATMKSVGVQADTTGLLQFCSELEEVRFLSPLTAVGKECCNNCHHLKKVSFAPTVTSIGDGAFSYSGLESVTIPGTVKRIGVQAFAECENLREVIIGEGVKEIDAQAFTRCHKLERVVLPASLSYLSKDAFDDCTPSVELDFRGEPWQWWNLTAEYWLRGDNHLPHEKKMIDVEYDASVFMNCTVFMNSDGTRQLRRDGETVGAAHREGYPHTEYLIAVEDAENGLLHGGIAALAQVRADENGNIAIPDHLQATDGAFLNLYGACRHPSAHLNEEDAYCCDVCGERLPAVIDLGKRVGDADRDGSITIHDVTTIQRHLAEMEQIPERFLPLADTNGEGTVDVNDATHLQLYLAEYEVGLGKQP